MNKYLKKYFLKFLLILLLNGYSPSIYSNILNRKKNNDQYIQLQRISQAHNQCLIQFQNKLLNIEQEIDNLRGKIQENEHKLLHISNKQNEIMQKINFLTNENINIKKNNTISCTENKNLSNIDNDHHFKSYNKAVNLVLEKKQYEKAVQEFKEFILKYPHSIYHANAHYWLGQLHYRLGNKNEASYHFALVAKNYPQSLKASDALLKVGIIMEENKHKEKAKLIYKQIKNLYPNTESAKQSQKRLNNLD